MLLSRVSKPTLALVTTVAILALTGPAHADSDNEGWKTSFVPSALPQTLTDKKLLVTAAGNHPMSANSAAEALRLALNNAGAPLVMDASSLGAVSDLPDQKIVEEASGLPVEATVVVRVFDGATSLNAVVSAYATDGEAIAGFSVKKGEKLTADQSNNPAQGISQETLDATRSTDDPESDDKASQNLRYHFSPDDNWKLRDRKTGTSHTGVDIYQTLGYPDFAEDYRRRRRIKTALQVGAPVATILGGVATGAGIAMIVPGRRCESDGIGGYQNCPSFLGHNPVAGGVTVYAAVHVLAFGIGATFAAGSYDVHPVDKKRLRGMTEKNNEPLDTEQNNRSDDSAEPRSSRRPPRLGWSIVPVDGGMQTGLRIRW